MGKPLHPCLQRLKYGDFIEYEGIHGLKNLVFYYFHPSYDHIAVTNLGAFDLNAVKPVRIVKFRT